MQNSLPPVNILGVRLALGPQSLQVATLSCLAMVWKGGAVDRAALKPAACPLKSCTNLQQTRFTSYSHVARCCVACLLPPCRCAPGGPRPAKVQQCGVVNHTTTISKIFG